MLNLYSYSISQINYANFQKWPIVYIRPNSFILKILFSLYQYGLIQGFFVDYNEINIFKRCQVFLRYKNGHSVFTFLKLIHRPGRQIFITRFKLWRLARKSPSTLFFLSTSKGIVAYNLKDIFYLSNNNNKLFHGGLLLFTVDLW